MSQIIKTRLTKTSNTLKSSFLFKNFVPGTLRSSFNYKLSCGSYADSYVGKTFRHFKVRVSEHQSVSPRTIKPIKGTLSTSVMDHMLAFERKEVHEDFKFLGIKFSSY